jgi:hypothetical protein
MTQKPETIAVKITTDRMPFLRGAQVEQGAVVEMTQEEFAAFDEREFGKKATKAEIEAWKKGEEPNEAE